MLNLVLGTRKIRGFGPVWALMTSHHKHSWGYSAQSEKKMNMLRYLTSCYYIMVPTADDGGVTADESR